MTFCYRFDCICNQVTAKIYYVVLVRKQVTFFLHRCSNGCLNKNRRKPGRRFSCFRNFGHYHKLLKSKCRIVLFIRMSPREKRKYCSKVSCMSETSASQFKREYITFHLHLHFIFSSVRSFNSHPNLLLITTPTFSDHSGPQHWTYTFWATTAI